MLIEALAPIVLPVWAVFFFVWNGLSLFIAMRCYRHVDEARYGNFHNQPDKDF